MSRSEVSPEWGRGQATTAEAGEGPALSGASEGPGVGWVGRAGCSRRGGGFARACFS